MTVYDVHNMLNRLTLQEKEVFLAEQLRKLPAESRSRVISFCKDVSLNTNQASEFDPDTFFQRLADFWNSERKNREEKNLRSKILKRFKGSLY